MDERDEQEEPQRRPRPANEGVRIIGAEEAAAALEKGEAAGRRPEDAPRFGDVPPQPAGPRPAHRFPLPDSVDPASAVPRPPVAPSSGSGSGAGSGPGSGSGSGPSAPAGAPGGATAAARPPEREVERSLFAPSPPPSESGDAFDADMTIETETPRPEPEPPASPSAVAAP